MSQHINICWDYFLSILVEFPSCNNLSKLSKLSNCYSINNSHYVCSEKAVNWIYNSVEGRS